MGQIKCRRKKKYSKGVLCMKAPERNGLEIGFRRCNVYEYTFKLEAVVTCQAYNIRPKC